MKQYQTIIPGGGHWSLKIRRGVQMTLTDIEGGGNLGMLFYNPDNLLERYNAPDTLKGQHTFKLSEGHCLYSDMGRIFCSITKDTFGWHDTVCGNSNSNTVKQKWGKRDYQIDRNNWQQNGYDSFLVELEKYGLGHRDLAANVNWFSKVKTNKDGQLSLEPINKPGAEITLRFEMDTLVLLHACPHPLNSSNTYPCKGINIELSQAAEIKDDDKCINFCDENKRGYTNNQLYYLGSH